VDNELWIDKRDWSLQRAPLSKGVHGYGDRDEWRTNG